MKRLVACAALLLAACEHVPPASSVREDPGPKVLMRVLVKTDGTVGELEVVKSSGSLRTDNVAIEAIRKAKFRPILKDGIPTDAWALVPVVVDTPYAPEASRAEQTPAMEARRNAVTRALIQSYAATLKADYSAMSAHCSALDKNYIPRFSERRAYIEQEWLESIRQFQLVSFFAADAKKHPFERDSLMDPMATAKDIESLPGLSAEIQEKIKQNSNEKLKVAMNSLSPDQQRARCEAALLPQAIKPSMVGK